MDKYVRTNLSDKLKKVQFANFCLNEPFLKSASLAHKKKAENSEESSAFKKMARKGK